MCHVYTTLRARSPHLIPPSTAVIATRCLGGRLTRKRITLDVKYVPISMDSSSDNTCAGIENLAWAAWGEREREGGGGVRARFEQGFLWGEAVCM